MCVDTGYSFYAFLLVSFITHKFINGPLQCKEFLEIMCIACSICTRGWEFNDLRTGFCASETSQADPAAEFLDVIGQKS